MKQDKFPTQEQGEVSETEWAFRIIIKRYPQDQISKLFPHIHEFYRNGIITQEEYKRLSVKVMERLELV